AGFERSEVVAVEGIGWIMPDFEDRWADPANRRHILDIVALTEREPSILGVSQHLLGVGWSPA
ncbi:MAG: class I SAM-dependent methyltransferase, partial [Acidimicrobiia bacterium]|nr:class I SAM-dependent methyltransferase [Acidimicrobiia bacterium]NNL14217.1 class I SAM-dependent methyltransferase [Acidimicrobiia bacterium]